jgi:hypothetical protein
MNRELISNLYAKAVDYCVEQGPNPDGTNKAWLWEEKFAELVVLECVALQYKNIIVGSVSEYNRGRRELTEDILKHFGAEE